MFNNAKQTVFDTLRMRLAAREAQKVIYHRNHYRSYYTNLKRAETNPFQQLCVVYALVRHVVKGQTGTTTSGCGCRPQKK